MSEENTDFTTTSIAHIIENGSEEEIKMLLGGRDKIRHAGIIRAGKRRPLNGCTAQEKAIFSQLEAEGLPYDDIDRKMGGKPKTRESKLTTVNTDHFVIREMDFKKPADAEFIAKNYADPDGKVRRIPVFFTVSDIDKAIPHGYTAFDGGSNLRCKSFYDGDDLKFRYIEKSVTAPKAGDWKILDSNDEDDATKACGHKVTFSGMYRVNVVGLRGIGEVIIPNKSWNGMGDAVAVLNKIKKRLGRIDGLLNGQHFFELCKTQEMVKHEGKKVKQSIITLELSVDPMEIERYSEPAQAAARAQNAMRMLTGGLGSAPLNCARAVEGLAPLPSGDDLESRADDSAEESQPFTIAPLNPRDELKPAIKAIEMLANKEKVPVDHIWSYLIELSGGVMVTSMTIEELRQHYQDLMLRLKEERAQFTFDAKSSFMRLSKKTGTGDLPFGG